jgi:hypothetical protein
VEVAEGIAVAVGVSVGGIGVAVFVGNNVGVKEAVASVFTAFPELRQLDSNASEIHAMSQTE